MSLPTCEQKLPQHKKQVSQERQNSRHLRDRGHHAKDAAKVVDCCTQRTEPYLARIGLARLQRLHPLLL